jgi:DNA repair protein RadC
MAAEGVLMQASLALVESEDDVQLLQSLSPGTSRRVWAAALLANGGLRGLIQASDARLAEHLGNAAIATLRASFEVAKRFRVGADERPRLETPHAIAEFLMPELSHLSHERFVVLALNSRNVLLKQVTVADGSVDQCHVDPRAVFAAALQAGATGIVLAHNHPSGSAEPSQQDVALTRQLREAVRTLCIRLLDHIIIGAGSHVSLLARELLRRD